MKPFLHGRIHARKYGGVPEDYADIDDFIDSSKACVPDIRHRALLHNSLTLMERKVKESRKENKITLE